MRTIFLRTLLSSLCLLTQGVAADTEEAISLARNTIIVDGHVDLPYRLWNSPEDVSVRTASGEMDFPRAKEGGLDAPFMSIYIPASYQNSGGAKAHADALIDMIEGLASDHPDKFALAGNPDEIRENFQKGLISLPMGMENGAGLEGDLDNVQYFYERGIRYITLTHSTDNDISDSSYATTAIHDGLSIFGEEVVREMNRTGIMIDVSHISDAAFYDVMEITEVPVIASHSSLRHFIPGFHRNMDDAMIKRIGENGGVVMINFGSTFVKNESRNLIDYINTEFSAWLDANDLQRSDPRAQAYRAELYGEKLPYATIAEVADHFDRVVDLTGIDHVGFGSDYDGVGPTLPIGLKDVSRFPALIEELLARGYTEDDITKIAHGNIFRVWDRVNEYAETN